jgi:hypothetical protein
VSFARPLKLFTAEEGLIVKRIAILKTAKFNDIVGATIKALQSNCE